MLSDHGVLLRLLVALGIGLLIGIERERRKGKGPDRAAAGLRTFALAALWGGLCATLGGAALLATGAAVVGVFAVMAYLRSRDDDPGLTTEIALITTYLLGALAAEQPALAGALGVIVAGLLASKRTLHRFVSRLLTQQELHSALVLLAAAIVVLPLAPDRGMGPFEALNPRTIWRLVVLIMAIGAVGHLLHRLLGARWGMPLSGFASGFVSSSATIGLLGSRAQQQPAFRSAAVAGATLSSVATVIQMIVVLAATDAAVLRLLLPALVATGIATLAWSAYFTIRSLRAGPLQEGPPGHPFEIRTALIFAATLAGVLFLTAATAHLAGTGALVVVASLAGFADTHAAAVSVASLSTSGHLPAAQAALPILLALSANTLTKMLLAIVMGGRIFALQVIPGLLLALAAGWATAWFSGAVAFG